MLVILSLAADNSCPNLDGREVSAARGAGAFCLSPATTPLTFVLFIHTIGRPLTITPRYDSFIYNRPRCQTSAFQVGHWAAAA